MSTRSQITVRSVSASLESSGWMRLGLLAAAASIAAVLAVQAVALGLWPEIARFRPLDSYARSAVFVLVPVLAATAIFAWLARRSADPVPAFLRLSAAALLLSFFPDYALPDPNKTVLASTVAAFLHVVAAAASVGVLVRGYRRMTARPLESK